MGSYASQLRRLEAARRREERESKKRQKEFERLLKEEAKRSAIIYTVIESCRRRGLDPHAYLRDVLTRLPRLTNWQIKDITPAAWAKAQRRSPLQLAS